MVSLSLPCLPCLDGSKTFQFLATEHILDQGPDDQELAREPCELFGCLTRRVDLAPSAMCSSASHPVGFHQSSLLTFTTVNCHLQKGFDQPICVNPLLCG